jgi:predicted cupin superfamily sugar epimerase
MQDQARAIIERLNMAPHPEGGWYRETWRAAARDGGRSPGTATMPTSYGCGRAAHHST